MDRSSRKKINKVTQVLNDILDQFDLIDIYRAFHPKTVDCTFFSSAHRTFSRIGHILGHISSLCKSQRIEIISGIIYNHNAIRLDINYTQLVRICLECRRPGFDSWVGKMPWRREWQPTLVFSPGESPWTEAPGGLQSMGSQRVRHDRGTNAFTFRPEFMNQSHNFSTP